MEETGVPGGRDLYGVWSNTTKDPKGGSDLVATPEGMAHDVDDGTVAGQPIHDLVDALLNVVIPVGAHLVRHCRRDVEHQFRAFIQTQKYNKNTHPMDIPDKEKLK